MQTTKFSELMAMGPFGFVAVDEDRVNLDDLIHALSRPGSIVRCYGDPRECIQVYSDDSSAILGCVAGWMSEDEPSKMDGNGPSHG